MLRPVRGDDVRREDERQHPRGAGRRLARGHAGERGVGEPPPLRGDAAVARGAVQREPAQFMADNAFPDATEDGLLGKQDVERANELCSPAGEKGDSELIEWTGAEASTGKCSHEAEPEIASPDKRWERDPVQPKK